MRLVRTAAMTSLTAAASFFGFHQAAAAEASAESVLTLSQSAPAAPTEASSRYGPWDLFDHRSKFNTNWFPEPLLGDEMDADQEIRLNYFHAEKRGIREDEVGLEVEKTFGLLTIELEVPYVREDDNDEVEEGIGAIELSARHPFYQYVSNDGVIDLTLGARVEFAIPSGSDVSKNSELVGGVYETLGLGEHFSIQASVAYSTLFGPNDASGEQVLEYLVVFGYNVEVEKFLGLSRVTPIFEITGETGMNHGEEGTTDLDGVVGALFNFQSVGAFQPKFAIGYVFPISDVAQDSFDWGITTSLIFEY